MDDFLKKESIFDKVTKKLSRSLESDDTIDDTNDLLKKLIQINKHDVPIAGFNIIEKNYMMANNDEEHILCQGKIINIQYMIYESYPIVNKIIFDKVQFVGSAYFGRSRNIKIKFRENDEYIFINNNTSIRLPNDIKDFWLACETTSLYVAVRCVFSDIDNIQLGIISQYPFASYETGSAGMTHEFRPATVDNNGKIYINSIANTVNIDLITGAKVKITDGTDDLSINTDGSINSNLISGAKVKITDGTSDLDIRTDGSLLVNSLPDTKTFITKSYDWSSAVNNVSIWTPASDKKFVILDIILSCSTGCTVTLFDQTNNLTNRILKGYFITNGGLVCNYQKRRTSLANNNILKMTTSGTGGSITISGYEG